MWLALIKGKIKNPFIFKGFYDLKIQMVKSLENKGKMTICKKQTVILQLTCELPTL